MAKRRQYSAERDRQVEAHGARQLDTRRAHGAGVELVYGILDQVPDLMTAVSAGVQVSSWPINSDPYT